MPRCDCGAIADNIVGLFDLVQRILRKASFALGTESVSSLIAALCETCDAFLVSNHEVGGEEGGEGAGAVSRFNPVCQLAMPDSGRGSLAAPCPSPRSFVWMHIPPRVCE